MTVKLLRKIYGLKIKIPLNENGFVLLELIVGLPMILLLLWTMSNLFINTWQQCKFLIADFILQQEMQSAMLRIVDDARIAYEVYVTDNQLHFKHHEMPSFTEGIKDVDNGYKPWYKRKDGKIYLNGESSPITGDDDLSKTTVTDFKFIKISDQLWRFTIEAKSNVSGHKIKLSTEVFLRGHQ